MKKIIVFLLFSISLFAQGWQWQYPKPQGNTLWGLQVINESTVVAVGELGTIIKTTDRGESWEVTHHTCGMSGHLVSVYFQDAVTGWAVGSSGTMLKTTDAGETWIKQDTVTSRGLTSIYFVNADTGWVVGTGSCETGAIVLKTTDGGDSWTSQIIGFHVHTFNSVYFTNDSTGWIAGDGYWGNEIFRTTDCGETWIQQDIEPRVYCMRKIQFIDEHTGFMISEFGDFLRTTNGGESWEYQNLSDIDPDRLKYAFPYSLHFVNADTGWIAGGDYYGYILKTTDGGENWVEADIDEVQGQLYNIQFSDTEHGWAVGRFGLIYRTDNGGESWVSQRDEQYGFSSIYFINEDTGWVAGEKGSIFYTDDGGLNWYKQNHSDSLSFSSIYAIDNKNVFAVGAVIKGLSIFDRSGIIFRTINGGQAWERQNFDTLYGFNSIVFTNVSTGWISGTNSTLLKTNNRGNTWNKITLDTNFAEGKIQFINENIGWIGGTLKTIDGGENWFSQIIPLTSLNSFNFVDTEMGWAIGTYNGFNNILKTIDGGDNWIPCGITPPGYNFSIQFVNETIGWISGFDYLNRTSIILKTTNGGYSWIEQKSPCKNEGGFSDIFFINEKIGWAIGEGIIKTTTGGNTGINSIYHSSKMPQKILLFQNYPNPFNPSTTIRYVISKPSYVSVKVYDLLGREVETLVKEYQSAGKYTIHWTGENYPSGLYLYQLQAGEFCETRKFMLIK